MKFIPATLFGLGTLLLVMHLLFRMSGGGLRAMDSSDALALLVMAGVAHLLWGTKEHA